MTSCTSPAEDFDHFESFHQDPFVVKADAFGLVRARLREGLSMRL